MIIFGTPVTIMENTTIHNSYSQIAKYLLIVIITPGETDTKNWKSQKALVRQKQGTLDRRDAHLLK